MKTENLIYKMLTESTGSALCDSGDAYGRHWEKNQKRSLKDFQNEKPVFFDTDDNTYTISVFHYLTSKLDLDDTCDTFNKMKCNDWNSDIYGISLNQETWLKDQGFTFGETYNTYNGETSLSQVLQYTTIYENGDFKYYLIQIHNGCDVRGGYTDAKLFLATDNYLSENVIGSFKRGKKEFYISNMYNGYSLTLDDSDQEYEYKKGDVVTLDLVE